MDNAAPYLIDVSRPLWRKWQNIRATGIDRICEAWLAHYRDKAQAVVVLKRWRLILPVEGSRALFDVILDGAGGNNRGNQRLRIMHWLSRYAPAVVRSCPGRNRPWFNIGHTGLDRTGLGQWTRLAGVRPVIMVHDLIPITHPQFCRPGEAQRHRERMINAIAMAQALITNSAHTLETLSSFAEAHGLAMPPSTVAWPGTPIMPLPRLPTTTNRTDFVVLGTIEGRKNHRMLLEIWKRLCARMGHRAPRLVIIGRRGWEVADVLSTLDSDIFADRVVEAGPLDDAGIASWLAGARALLFPSFAEGYGMPLAEALAAGVPVVASDLPVFREIGQGVPDLLPVDDAKAWEAAVLDYASPDSSRRNRQLARIARYEAPTWSAHFNKVQALVDRLASEQTPVS